MTTQPWLTCTLWLGDEQRVCGAQAAHRYLTGPRCPKHTPAAIAGRRESVPDPSRTLVGLLAGPSLTERRTAPRPQFRPASVVRGNQRFYSSDDLDYGRVRAAAALVGHELERRRQAEIAHRDVEAS